MIVFTNFLDPVKMPDAPANAQFDSRLNIYSTITKGYDEDQLYFNYIKLMKEMFINNPTIDMLSMGCIPVIAPPFFTGHTYFQRYGYILKNVEFYSRPPLTVYGFYYKSDKYDIWMHRMDLAPLLNCRPEEVTVEKTIRGLLK